MIKTISISGMTCINCEKSIHEKITSLTGVNKVVVSLKDQNAIIDSKNIINNENIQEAIGAKYSISDLEQSKKESKIWQLKPLLLIFKNLNQMSFKVLIVSSGRFQYPSIFDDD
jgi:copper chaperone CopZ